MPQNTENDSELGQPNVWDDAKGRRTSADMSAAEQNATLDDSDIGNRSGNDSNDATAEAREAESSNTGAAPGNTSVDTTAGTASGTQSGKFNVSNIKKKGALAFINALIIGIMSLFAILNIPGLLIVQVKEILVDDLMDAVAAVDARAQGIVKARINNDVVHKSGLLCNSKISVRCKYKGISKKQLEKLQKAGVHVETSGRTLGAKYKVTALVVPAPDGSLDTNKGAQRVDAKNFKKMYAGNDDFRLRMNKAYAPRWMAMNDKVVEKIKKKYKISYERSLGGQTEEEMKRKMDEDIRNGTTESDGRGTLKSETDEDGKAVVKDPTTGEIVKDASGNPVNPNELDNSLKAVEEGARDGVSFSAGGGIVEGLSRAAGAGNTFTGTQASVCGILTVLRTAGLTSRNAKFVQLLRYVVPLMNTADSIKNGTATPQATAMVGDTLTHDDQRKKILTDEDSLPNASDDLSDMAKKASVPASEKEKDNPNYGKNGLDASTFRAAAYGETPNLSTSDAKFAQNSAGGSKMSGLAGKVKRVPGFDASRCSLYTNPVVQIGGGVVTGTLGLLTGPVGVSGLVVQTFKTAAIIALQYALTNWMMGMIQNVVKGELVNSDLQGVDAMNASFSGAAALGTVTASSRGMVPLSTHEEVQQYQVASMRVKQQDYRVEQLAARDTPFDVYNRASFLGSIVWDMTPRAYESSKTMAGMVSMPLQLLGSIPSWLSPTSHAAPQQDISRFTKNDDDEIFQEMNLKGADIMGNVRFGMTEEQLNADPQKIMEWMIDARQVDASTGEPLTTDDALTQAACLAPSDEKLLSSLQFDDETLADVDTSHVGQSDQATLSDYELPYPAAGQNLGDCNGNRQIGKSTEKRLTVGGADETRDPSKDVRTFAHFLRYCRFGDDTGRKVNFGDLDGGDDKNGFVANALNGIAKSDWKSDGRECLRSNACKPNQNPNGDSSKLNDERYTTFCRPSYYDIYAVYVMDNGADGKSGIADSMDADDEEDEESTDTGALGSAQEEARKVLANDNIVLQASTRGALQKFADTGEATNACGEKYAIHPLLLWVMNENSKKYKVWVNNFGFREDRNFCDGSATNQHRMGHAIDLNGVEKTGAGGNKGWGSISYTPEQTKLITEYAVDWMNTLATKDPRRGRSGQLGCGGYTLLDKKDPKWQGYDGNLHFSDSCDHLHIDIGDRIDPGRKE